jgi:hypothetical protein
MHAKTGQDSAGWIHITEIQPPIEFRGLDIGTPVSDKHFAIEASSWSVMGA